MEHDMRMHGFDLKLGGWPMPWGLDLHHHLRMGPMSDLVTPLAAKHYRLVTAMPNLGKARIRTPSQAHSYKFILEEIGRKTNPDFEVNVPLYLEPNTDPAVVEVGHRSGAWMSAKLYPRGGTTNSAEGVDFLKLEELSDVFELMSNLGMPLLVHAEPTHSHDGTEIDVFDREHEALPHLDALFKRHPRLMVVFEHISTKAATEQIARWIDLGYNIQATVAPQYLLWNRNELFRGGINPGKYSIPVLKREEDRLALVNFIIGEPFGYGLGFLGTDSAPHPLSAKSKPEGCSGGVFNAPVALFIYFEVFRSSGYRNWFDRFVQFACVNGPRFYGLPLKLENKVLIVEKPWTVPETYGEGANAVRPMWAGEQCPYDLQVLQE